MNAQLFDTLAARVERAARQPPERRLSLWVYVQGLKRGGRCASCCSRIPRGGRAYWCRESGALNCQACGAVKPHPAYEPQLALAV
ncbi:MAG: hypothetical protein WC700_08955 [Gemmatimonadaceae bacterium]|jgi:hypothetical protein